jgi:hypothetical protein
MPVKMNNRIGSETARQLDSVLFVLYFYFPTNCPWMQTATGSTRIILNLHWMSRPRPLADLRCNDRQTGIQTCVSHAVACTVLAGTRPSVVLCNAWPAGLAAAQAPRKQAWHQRMWLLQAAKYQAKVSAGSLQQATFDPDRHMLVPPLQPAAANTATFGMAALR